ncbi:MAG: hypothetical protein ACQES4_04825 [Bacillota bacterium]
MTALKREEIKQKTYNRIITLLDHSPSQIMVFDDNGNRVLSIDEKNQGAAL